METRQTYQLFSLFYDAYTKEFAQDIPLYLKLCDNKKKILEIGCGTGRILKAITKPGRLVTGVDISEEMLAIASQKMAEELKSNNLKIFNFDFKKSFLPEKYDIVLVTWYTFNYIADNPVKFLKNVRLSMQPDSLLVLDLFCPKPLSDPSLQDVWTQKELRFNEKAILLEDKRSMKNSIEERIQRYHYDKEIHEIITERRYYPPDEISEILRTSGFGKEFFVEDYDLSRKTDAPAGDYVCIAGPV